VRALFLLVLLAFAGPAEAARLKDIVTVENVRPNQLIGYGVVVGLAGTGDKLRRLPFARAAIASMLDRFGAAARGQTFETANAAVVMVTAQLPPFARSGLAIDVQVAAMGDATSLQGGTLLATQLQGLDGEVYAVAQGLVTVSGFSAKGAAASVTRGVPTSARIAGGALVEREVGYELSASDTTRLSLRNPDFATASAIGRAIDAKAGRAVSKVLDPATVSVDAHGWPGGLVALMASVGDAEIAVDTPAKVVVDEASGTVVIGENVTLRPVAIAQGGLTITVTETPEVSQPAPFSQGTTTTVPRTQIGVEENRGRGLARLGPASSLKDLVAGLNALAVTPRDLITVLQALKAAGALQAEIEVR
jgi:flagellar P-ring protein precursor FlgI